MQRAIPGFRLLRAGDFDSAPETSFGRRCGGGIAGEAQFAVQPMHLSFVIEDAGPRDMGQRLRHHAQPLRGIAGLAAGFGKQGEPMRILDICAGPAVGIDAPADGVDAFLTAALLDQRPAAQSGRVRGEKREDMFVRKRQGGVGRIHCRPRLAAQLMQHCSPLENIGQGERMPALIGGRDRLPNHVQRPVGVAEMPENFLALMVLRVKGG